MSNLEKKITLRNLAYILDDVEKEIRDEVTENVQQMNYEKAKYNIDSLQRLDEVWTGAIKYKSYSKR